MPLKPQQTEAPAPKVPHFALLTDVSGQRTAIPPGASLWLVEDASQMDKIFPLTLKKVSLKKLHFEMITGDNEVTEYVYELTTAKPKSVQAYRRLLANRAGKPVVTQR